MARQEQTIGSGAEDAGEPDGAPGEEIETEVEKETMEDEEERRKPRVGLRPVQPTRAEVAEHYPLHLNYRSWCDHCRAGKARLAPHLKEPADRERLGITVSCDYAFMGAEEADEADEADNSGDNCSELPLTQPACKQPSTQKKARAEGDLPPGEDNSDFPLTQPGRSHPSHSPLTNLARSRKIEADEEAEEADDKDEEKDKDKKDENEDEDEDEDDGEEEEEEEGDEEEKDKNKDKDEDSDSDLPPLVDDSGDDMPPLSESSADDDG